MWKKEDEQLDQPSTERARPDTPRSAAAPAGRASIGPSIAIKGEVTGSEDLLIEGRVDGSVSLGRHSVAVGGEGCVHANITGRVITVEGEVEGDLTAEEQIVLRGSARVQGDIKAPRVVLEDGATFRGLVDMSAATKARKGEEASARDATSASVGDAASTGANGAATGTPPGAKEVALAVGASEPRPETGKAGNRGTSGGRGSSDTGKGTGGAEGRAG